MAYMERFLYVNFVSDLHYHLTPRSLQVKVAFRFIQASVKCQVHERDYHLEGKRAVPGPYG